MHELDPARSPSAIIAEIGADERELIVACTDLYAGSWDDLAEDVRRRQSGQPYLFRLRQDPGDTLVWASRFKAYEDARGARLVDALPPEDVR